eukprot:jgi/Tetstr1/440839/TSEL_000255.t1
MTGARWGGAGIAYAAHAARLERIASFDTSGYGCHHGAMRLLVVCAVLQTGFLSRLMPPSELDPFLKAVDAANILSPAFSFAWGSALVKCHGPTCGIDPLWLRSADGPIRNATDFVVDHLPICPVANYKHRMHTALKNMRASVAIEAGAVLDMDRSGVNDLTLETSVLCPADRSRPPSDLTLVGWGAGPASDYLIDFACMSSTTPT